MSAPCRCAPSRSLRWTRALRVSRTDRERDAGISLIELIVSMGIFTVVVAVFMAGVVIMTSNTARSQAVGDAGDGVRKIFLRLDREVRYASDVNSPVLSNGKQYVEYRTTAVEPGQPPLCTQWRYRPTERDIQVRSWADVGTRSPSAWSTVAVNVRNDFTVPAELPFHWKPVNEAPSDPKDVSTRQQLWVTLDVGPGPTGGRTGAQLESVFVARNSSATSPSNRDADLNGLSDDPVCQVGVGRP